MNIHFIQNNFHPISLILLVCCARIKVTNALSLDPPPTKFPSDCPPKRLPLLGAKGIPSAGGRRQALFRFGSFVMGTTLLAPKRPSYASEQEVPLPQETRSVSDAPRLQARERLLNLLLIDGNKNKKQNKEDDYLISAAVQDLVSMDPSKGQITEQDLDGEWQLLWSKTGAASPLTKLLPYPFTPDSYQYLGAAAASEVGEGRVAQGLTGGLLLGKDRQLWLSSGVQQSASDPSVLVIQPPFRFQLGGPYQSGQAKTTLVEAGSDAEFRKVNLRTQEAQKAPLNLYQQVYLEKEGKGSLRISTIVDGDPVIVGEVLVHIKL